MCDLRPWLAAALLACWGTIVPAAELQPAQNDAREKQIAQQAKQLENIFRPLLLAELELVKSSCGSLEPGQRKQILQAGEGAVAAVARDSARQRFGMAPAEPGPIDPPKRISAAVIAAVEPLAAAGELAAYRAELEQRAARRQRRARELILARLDLYLCLTPGQRTAIEADLEQRWNPEWTTILPAHPVFFEHYTAAADFAAEAIEPHLDPAQLGEWKVWIGKAAGSKFRGHQPNLAYGRHFLEPDPWWNQ